MTDEILFENINLRGFQVVQSDYFKRDKMPWMSIFKKEISFSREAHTALNNCETIQIMINPESKTVIIRPATSTEGNTLTWERHTKSTYIPRFFCPTLTTKLYGAWDWNPRYRYRADGRLVMVDHKMMLLFDFRNATAYDRAKQVKQ